MPELVFAEYVLAQLFRSVGWPRKSGFFGHNIVVETSVVDIVGRQLVIIGIGLGVGRPVLAVRLIADSFQKRDWSKQSATEFLESLDPNQRVLTNPNQRPCEVIAPTMENMGRKSIPWKWLCEPRLAIHYTGTFSQALIWGLLHPEEAENALNEERLLYEQWVPFLQSAGTMISTQYAWSTNEDFYKNCEEIVKIFVHDIRQLVDTPKELRSEASIERRLKEIK